MLARGAAAQRQTLGGLRGSIDPSVAQGLLDVLQQDGGQLGDRFGRAIVALHQLFRGPSSGSVGVAEQTGHRTLQVEDQPVFTPICRDVQRCSNAPHA